MSTDSGNKQNHYVHGQKKIFLELKFWPERKFHDVTCPRDSDSHSDFFTYNLSATQLSIKNQSSNSIHKQSNSWYNSGSGFSYTPPTSVPKATGHNPDETIAAGPDDEPPVYRFTS